MVMRSKKLLAFLLIATLVPSVGFARRGFHRWWLQPKADPIQDATFKEVFAYDAVCLDVQRSDSGVGSWEWTEFTETTLSAEVVEGDLIIAPFDLEEEIEDGATDGATMSITIDPAVLKQKRRCSEFRTTGVAVVGTDEVELRVRGSICERGGEYLMKARIFGHLRTEGADEQEVTTVSHKVIWLKLKGAAEVLVEPVDPPVEPVDPPVDPPAEPA
jgi:hypothetical protein